MDHETPIFGIKIPKIFELPPPSDLGILGVGGFPKKRHKVGHL